MVPAAERWSDHLISVGFSWLCKDVEIELNRTRSQSSAVVYK